MALLLSMIGVACLTACSGISFNAAGAEATPVPTVTVGAGLIAEGRVVPHQSATLAFPVGGRLGDQPVEAGAKVDAGTVLASLTDREQADAALKNAELELEVARQQKDNLDQDAGLAQAQAEQGAADAQSHLTEAQKAYDDTHTRDYRNQLDDKEESYQQAKTDLDEAQKDLDKYKDLDVENSTRKSAQTTYDNAKEDYQKALYERDGLLNRQKAAESGLTLAQETLAKAQRTLENVKDGQPDPDLLAQAEKRLAAAQAQVDAAQKALANMDLTAPFAGTLMDWADGMLPGVWLSAGQPVAYLADTSAWEIETTDLTELKVVEIKEGQAADIRLDALPDVPLTGEVISVGRVYYEKSGDVQYKVRIRIDAPPAGIRWGMTAEVTFGN
ncbi:HlyD family secretion protein [Longilinea arvoryzae]|nr:HlyD family efflux transporter periplasmic adaptor subunit [Longilinea arvoryzae]